MGEGDRVPVEWEPGEAAARALLSGLDEGEKVFLYRKYVDPKGKTHWSVEGDVDRTGEGTFGYHDPGRGGVTDLDGAVYFVTTVKSDHYQRVASRAWSYAAGGYRVLKKWLSYREFEVLGRPLGAGDVRELSSAARRISALLLLGPELDANYRRASSPATRAPGRVPQERS